MDRTFPLACFTWVPTSVRKALAPAPQLSIVSKPISWTIKRFSKARFYVAFDFPRHLLLLPLVGTLWRHMIGLKCPLPLRPIPALYQISTEKWSSHPDACRHPGLGLLVPKWTLRELTPTTSEQHHLKNYVHMVTATSTGLTSGFKPERR